MPHGVAKKKQNAEKKTLRENYMLINKILLYLPKKGKNRYIWDLREKNDNEKKKEG